MVIEVTAYPYATVNGSIRVPDNLKTYEEVRDYLISNWNKIRFDEPDLDYEGTDFCFESNRICFEKQE